VEFIHPQVQELLGLAVKVTVKSKNELRACFELSQQITSHVRKRMRKRKLYFDNYATIVVYMDL
jgi:hypothetical protein